MKKILLVLLIKIFIVFPIYSQTNIGFKAGANLSTVIGEDATDFNSENPDIVTLGVVIGVIMKNEFNSFFWNNEVNYINKGAKWSIDGEDAYYKFSFNYLQLTTGPVMNFTDNLNFKLNLYGAYLLSAKQIMFFEGNKQIYKVEKDQLDDLNTRLDFGINTGFEFIINRNITSFLSYDLGLINFLSTDDDDESIRHSGFQLGIKYYINN